MLELSPENRVLLPTCSWEAYDRLLADHQDQSGPRFTYDRGRLEITSPGPAHERASEFVRLLIFAAGEELDIDVFGLGSATQRSPELERGVEPDSSFSFRDSDHPDLAVEIEVSRSSLDKLPIFAALNIQEVWRYDLNRLTIFRLEGSAYRQTERSSFLPLTSAEITEQLSRAGDRSHVAWLRDLRAWLRAR
ncbi:Uma2 family endonuclease [bacterium CPR1]|nr:Uma2 family endonuclease [bacterium CPR1]